VRSPEKVKKRMAEVESSLDKERKALLELEKQAVKSEAQLQYIVAIEAEVNSCLSLLRESVQVIEETSSKEHTIKKQRLEYCQFEQQIRDLSARDDYLSRLKQNNEEAQARQEVYFLPKIEKAKKKIAEISQERLASEKIKLELTSAMTIEEKKTKTCVLEREKIKREYDFEYASMQEASRALNQDLNTYTQQLKLLLNEGAKEFVTVV